MPGPLLQSLRLKVLVRDSRAGSLHAALSLQNAPKQLELSSGSDCVLPTEYDCSVPIGCITVDPVQAFNLRVCNNEAYEFRPFEAPEAVPFHLCDLEAAARMLPIEAASLQGEGAEIVRVDTQSIVEALQEQACGTVVAKSQSFVLQVKAALDCHKDGRQGACTTKLRNVQLALRVTSTDTLDDEQQAKVVAGYHCYRGVLTRDTRLYFHTESRPRLRGSPASHNQPHDSRGEPDGSSSGSGLQLVLERPRHRPPPKNQRDTINVHTTDCEGGEIYSVKKELLRPCIALTSAIRDESVAAPPPVHVDVDTLTFDRVLLFLESSATGYGSVLNQEPPMWSLHLIGDLARAADVLGLRPLASYCQERLGNLSDNLRIWRFDEVKRANDHQGKSLLILDGMVLDVSNWLSEHPGGPNIIPAQALNVDCGRFFEIYHASRESFLYLHDFYLGEIHPDDRPKVQQARGEHPSEDFLQQLAQYTPWRLPVSFGPSGDHLHLGRSAR